MKNSPALNAWKDMNSLLRTHKFINFGLIIVCIAQILVIAAMYFQDPIVVLANGENHEYLSGQRKHLPLSEKQVKRFTQKFLKLRYEWEVLRPESIQKNLSPFVTKGLGKKLFKLTKHLKEKELQNKATSQVIVHVMVEVNRKEVIATFDKLLRVDEVLIPIPTKVSLNLIRSHPNAWNPFGLLINGLVEHQSE